MWLLIEINLSTTLSILRTRWELSIHMVIWGRFTNNNEITTLFPLFIFVPKKTVWDYLKRGLFLRSDSSAESTVNNNFETLWISPPDFFFPDYLCVSNICTGLCHTGGLLAASD